MTDDETTNFFYSVIKHESDIVIVNGERDIEEQDPEEIWSGNLSSNLEFPEVLELLSRLLKDELAWPPLHGPKILEYSVSMDLNGKPVRIGYLYEMI